MKRIALLACAAALAISCSKSDDKTTCGEGTVLQGGVCVVPLTCPVGKVAEGGTCVDITCDAGYVLVGNDCVDVDECNPLAAAFHKTNGGTEEDCITPDVCITRGDQYSIYNSVVDPYDRQDCGTSEVPTGTRWARYPCSRATEDDFGPFLSAFAQCEPPTVVGVPGCLEVGDQYFDVEFGSWMALGYGGEFSYERREAPCGPGLTCINTPGSYTCGCESGFTLQDGACVDVDECAEGTDACDPSATCENLIGTYRCTCAGDVSFAKGDYGSEEDCITPDVCLTRGDQYMMYNSAQENAPAENGCSGGSLTPVGTLWAFGECSTVEPGHFGAFLNPTFADCSPPSVIDNPACLKIGDLYYDVTFDSWTQSGGGGFSYTRSNVVPPGVACE